MIKRRVIYGFYTVINFALLGYTGYRTMLRLTNISENKQKEIIHYLKQHSNVLWIVECGGRWDLIVNFMAKNITQYYQFLKEFKKKFPKQIQNYDVLTTVEIDYFGRDYLTKKTRNPSKIVGTKEIISDVKIDNLDLKILDLISENARINSVEISNKFKKSPNTIISRIKNLKKLGIIQGFKPYLHLENTNYSSYKALIKFQNITETKEKEIINSLKQNINIIGIIKLIGQWDFEIEFEVESKEKMLKLTREFRDKFKDVIRDFETIPLFKEYKYNFFPRNLIK